MNEQKKSAQDVCVPERRISELTREIPNIALRVHRKALVSDTSMTESLCLLLR